jgi:hypothetical protein
MRSKFHFEWRFLTLDVSGKSRILPPIDRVRLNGIDCPERGRDFGARAKQLTRPKCWGRYSKGSGSKPATISFTYFHYIVILFI